jgi:hypothetical protein
VYYSQEYHTPHRLIYVQESSGFSPSLPVQRCALPSLLPCYIQQYSTVGTDPVPEGRGTETLAGGAAANRSTWSASKRNEHSRESKRASDKMPGGTLWVPYQASLKIGGRWGGKRKTGCQPSPPPGHEMGNPWVG